MGRRESGARKAASMGPPSEDDGKLMPRGCAAGREVCFNGAAVRGRRKDDLQACGPVTAGFNGAAVRGRRKDPWADVEVPRQEGASMGPPSEDDGKMAMARGFTAVNLMLQWGRRPRTTERWAIRSALRLEIASMGPPSEDDGKPPSAMRIACSTRASMGPPSEDDGKMQWSRGGATQGFNGAAVRGRRKAVPSPSAGRAGPCFDGAAVRGRRKDCGRQAGVGPGRSASMGPPSEDDGKACVAHEAGNCASMGPPSEDDGKASEILATRLPQ